MNNFFNSTNLNFIKNTTKDGLYFVKNKVRKIPTEAYPLLIPVTFAGAYAFSYGGYMLKNSGDVSIKKSQPAPFMDENKIEEGFVIKRKKLHKPYQREYDVISNSLEDKST